MQQAGSAWVNYHGKLASTAKPYCAHNGKSPQRGLRALCCKARGPQYSRLTLAELFAATRFVETDFFTFDFTGIACNEASLLQRGLERFVVVDERAGNAVAYRTGLAAFTAAVNVDMKIERFQVVGEL